MGERYAGTWARVGVAGFAFSLAVVLCQGVRAQEAAPRPVVEAVHAEIDALLQRGDIDGLGAVLQSAEIDALLRDNEVDAIEALLWSGDLDALAWYADINGLLQRAEIDGLLRRVPNAGEEWIWGDSEQAQHVDPACEKLEELDAGEHLTPDQWAYVLQQKGVIRTRARWPEDVPLMVRMRCPRWLGMCEITAWPRVPAGKTVRAGTLTWSKCGNVTMARKQAEQFQVVGPLQGPPRALECEFQCQVELIPGSWHDGWRQQQPPPAPKTAWMGTVRIPVQVVATVEEAIMPIRSEETTRGMRKALIVAASIWRGDAPGLDVSVFLDRDAYESGREIAFGFSVDLLRDGQCVRTQEVEPDWLDGPNDPCPQSSGDAWFKGVKEADVAAPEVVDHWTLRIRGDGEMALRDWNRSQYWDGEATVPLAAALKNCVSPADFAQP